MRSLFFATRKNKDHIIHFIITENKDYIINFEIPPADHLTKKFILNPVEGSRSTPIRIQNKLQSVHGLTMRMKSLKALPIFSNS